jgi:hypothetical protein
MSDPDLKSIKFWHDRAEETRAIAKTLRKTRDHMLRVAAYYDQMALRAAEREIVEADCAKSKA